MSNSIRSACKEDLAGIKSIIDASFPRFYRYFAWHSVLDQSEPTFIKEVDGSIAGFAKLITFNVNRVKYGCILWIAVPPEFRCRGVALSLTQAGLERLKAQSVRAVFASTQHHNVGALSTLRRAGFAPVGLLGLRRLFGWSVFGFFRSIWFAPFEVVLMSGPYFEC